MKHRRRDRKRWERVVELLAVIMLVIPTSLILFSSELLWRGDFVASSLLLATFTVPPGLALWLIEHRRGRQGGRPTE
ncbi:hypothetical protein AB0C02_17900 [Micromonospora sp. NPDC048999]|uniref:hypothetical protein n=1 Tax=Micromonospora sp. NPDC048999 TaxID=3155391 RepID=UPI0033CFB140